MQAQSSTTNPTGSGTSSGNNTNNGATTPGATTSNPGSATEPLVVCDLRLAHGDSGFNVQRGLRERFAHLPALALKPKRRDAGGAPPV